MKPWRDASKKILSLSTVGIFECALIYKMFNVDGADLANRTPEVEV